MTQIFAETAVDKLVGKALLSFTGTKLVHDGVTYADSELLVPWDGRRHG